MLSWAFCCQGALQRGSAAPGGEGQREDEGHCWSQCLSGHKGRGVPGQRQGGQGFGGGSARPPGTGCEAKVIWITQAKPPTLAGIACIMSQFTVRSPPGPCPPPLLHGVKTNTAEETLCHLYK